MVKPNLLNPILVEIKQINREKTVWDDKKKQPVGVVVWDKPFKVQAQLYLGKDQYWSSATSVPDPRTSGGLIEVTEGYIVVRKSDLFMLGKTIRTMDVITAYGKIGSEIKCDFVLVGKKDAAHYADIGQCTLEKWFLKDKNAG